MKKCLFFLLLLLLFAGMALSTGFAASVSLASDVVSVSWCSDDLALVDYFHFPPVGERYVLVCLEARDGDIPAADIEAAMDAFMLIGPDGLARAPVAWRAYSVEEAGEAYAPSAAQRLFGFVYSIPQEIPLDDLALQMPLLSGVTYIALGDVLHMAYASALSK